MHTDITQHYTHDFDMDALNGAIKRSIKTGNQSIHSILKEAQSVIAEQQVRISELSRMATTDELTGILNRRGFSQVFERELDRLKREKNSDCNRLKGGVLLLIDLDGFKDINDTYGHAAGDAALKLVAKTLHMDIRKMDVAGRLGGDEFVVLFTNTTKAEAESRVEQLIHRLNNLSFIWKGHEIDVYASVGIKQYKAGDKISRVLSAADSAMYLQKENNLKEVITA
ncbi:MAG: GGDEF domain-containing protein [Pseudomonadota bacterium]